MTDTKEKRYKWRREDYRESTKGLLMVNTGDGKGKTTAALGVVVRAAGRGLKCCLIQFMKSKNDRYGEHESLEKLGVEESEVTPEASFTNDLGADSLDTVELIMEFEKEFNISIPDDQAENISTVGQAISYLEQNVKK